MKLAVNAANVDKVVRAWLIKRRHKSERHLGWGAGSREQEAGRKWLPLISVVWQAPTHTQTNIFHQLTHSWASELEGTKNFVPIFGDEGDGEGDSPELLLISERYGRVHAVWG